MASRKLNGVIRTAHLEPVEFWGKFDVGAGSAVTANTLSSGLASYITVTKPAGTGIYRLTFADTFQKVLWAKAELFKAAGTYDAKIEFVAKANEASATPVTVDFQVRKSSDGTALDPVSISIFFNVVLKNSTVYP